MLDPLASSSIFVVVCSDLQPLLTNHLNLSLPVILQLLVKYKSSLKAYALARWLKKENVSSHKCSICQKTLNKTAKSINVIFALHESALAVLMSLRNKLSSEQP